MSGSSLRKNGPIGHAPSAPTGSSHSAPNTANTKAREHGAHQSGTNSQRKDVRAGPSVGTLGTRGHGGAV